MKGHLDAKQLEKYNREDLEKLATELGVSTEGTDGQQGTDQLPGTDGQPASGLVKVACIQNYKDLQFNRIVETGEEYEVTPERAALLLEKNLVKRA